MCQSSGKILLAVVFIGLGVLDCAYPSDITLKSIKFYAGFLPLVAALKVNVLAGLVSFLTATALLLNKHHACCLVQTAVILHVALQGVPYIPALDASEQLGALITFMKCVGIFGASLIISK